MLQLGAACNRMPHKCIGSRQALDLHELLAWPVGDQPFLLLAQVPLRTRTWARAQSIIMGNRSGATRSLAHALGLPAYHSPTDGGTCRPSRSGMPLPRKLVCAGWLLVRVRSSRSLRITCRAATCRGLPYSATNRGQSIIAASTPTRLGLSPRMSRTL